MAKSRIRPISVLFSFSLLFIFVFIILERFQPLTAGYDSQTSQNGSYGVIICEEKHLKPALLLIHSLKQSKTKRDIITITLNLSDSSHKLLQQFGTKVFPQNSADLRSHGFEETEPLLFQSPFFSNASSDCLLAKMSAWKLVQYDKIVLLDPNMVIFQNIDELFGHPEPSGVSDYDLPGRLNPSLMVIRPDTASFGRMIRTLSEVHERLKPGVEELIFFNYVFFSWPELGPKHHLKYGYSAQVRLAYSATWDEWVSPNLKVAQFPACSTDLKIEWEKLYPAARKYENKRWRMIREMMRMLESKHSGIFSPSSRAPLCHPDHMSFGQGKMKNNKFSILFHFHGHSNSLKAMVARLSRLNQVHAMFVIPVSKFAVKAIPKAVSSKPKVVVWATGKFERSHRFFPIKQLATDCVLVMEDGVSFSPEHVISGFKVWQDHPHRLVGFYPLSHRRVGRNGSDSVHVASFQRHFSMVSTRFVFMHVDYLQDFTCSIPDGLKHFMNKMNDCEDVALNFLVASKTNQPPIWIFDPDTLADDSSLAKVKSSQTHHLTQRLLHQKLGMLQSMSDHSSSDLSRLSHDETSSSSSSSTSSSSFSAFDSLDHSKSMCINEIKKYFSNSIPLLETSVGRSRMKREVMTKISFSEWNVTTKFFPEITILAHNRTSNYSFDPVFFVPENAKAASNPKYFLKTFPSMGISPEVFVLPSLEFPSHSLCLRGFHSHSGCYRGEACENYYTVISLRDIPGNASLLLGSTIIIHVLSPSLDRFHLLHVFSNLFFSFQGYSFFQPARVLFFVRGGLLKSIDSWTVDLVKAALGESVQLYFPDVNSCVVCFEKVVVSRRYRKDLDERRLVASKFAERIASSCFGHPAAGKDMVGNEFLKFESEVEDGRIVKVFFLHDNDRTLGGNPIRNLEPLILHLKSICKMEMGCEIVVENAKSFQNLCQQVRHMFVADVFISISRKPMHHMVFMRSSKHVLELSPYGLKKMDHKVNKVNRELSTWMNLKHSILYESNEPKCKQNCGSTYQSRSFAVNEKEVGQWLKGVLDLHRESSLFETEL